jgi:hypothetical protein
MDPINITGLKKPQKNSWISWNNFILLFRIFKGSNYFSIRPRTKISTGLFFLSQSKKDILVRYPSQKDIFFLKTDENYYDYPGTVSGFFLIIPKPK